MPFIRAFFSALALLAIFSSEAAAQDRGADALRKIDRSLRASNLRAGSTRRVIVTVKAGYRDEIREALKAHGDVITSESPLINAVTVELHAEDVEELARHPWVELLSDDAVVRANAAPIVDHDRSGRVPAVPSTLRATLGLPNAPTWTTPGGAGIGVAIIDSGIAPLADFGDRITAFYDFTRGGIPTLPYDDNGHGTHIAGLIGSNGTLSGSDFVGVAPRVQLLGFKVLDRTGLGRTSDVIKAIEFITANKTRLDVDVINLSLGHPIFAPAGDDPLVRAVEKAVDAGITVVIAAGNYGQHEETGETGYTGIASPGNAPSAITVGAVNTQNTTTRADDTVTRYSSRGPTWFDGFAKPDVVAPGHQLVSDTTTGSYLFKALAANQRKVGRNQFLQLSGTSMAAAVATGVVAVLLDVNERSHYYRATPLSPNAVKAILGYTAIPIAGVDRLTQGAGTVNAIGAIALAGSIDTSAAVGSWWLRTGVTPHSYIGGEQYQWSREVMWGDRVLTGPVVYYNEAAWSVSAAWGDDNIVWGTTSQLALDNIVWGTASVWASNIVWSDRLIGQMSDADNIVWGTDADNIVWGTLALDNIVWGTWTGDNIVWGTWTDDNIVWGTDDSVVWGTNDDNVVWGTNDNVVWGTHDSVVWGTAILGRGGVF
jgi:serine protease AprX